MDIQIDCVLPLEGTIRPQCRYDNLGTMGSVENATSSAVRSKDGVKFGKELREKEFLFDKDYLNLNHGERILFFFSIGL